MKIESSSISTQTNEELIKTLNEDPSKLNSILQESLKRKNPSLLIEISKYISSPEQVKNTLSVLSKNFSRPEDIHIIEAILNNVLRLSPSILSDLSSLLTPFCMLSPKIAAKLMINKNTPKPVIEKIFEHYYPNITSLPNINGQILDEIQKLMIEGEKWDNETSGLWITTRLNQNFRDPFISNMAKYNINTVMVFALLNASKSVATQNKELKNNLQNNPNPNISMSIIIEEEQDKPIPEIFPKLVSITKEGGNVEIIWDFIEQKLKSGSWNINEFLLASKNNANFLTELSQKPEIAIKILDIMSKKINDINKKYEIEIIIHNLLNNPSLKNEILKLPEDFFPKIRMTPQDRNIINEHFKGKEENKEEVYVPTGFKRLFSNLNKEKIISESLNWYDKYGIIENSKLYEEAGIKNTLINSILTALILVLTGSSIYNASKKTNIKEEDIVNAMDNKELMNKAQIIMNSKKMSTENYRNKLIENILTRTIYEEGKGESTEGKIAIASVIYTRGKGSPELMLKAVQYPKQFSCWNNASKEDWTNMKEKQGGDWEESKQIAQSLINGTFSPIVNADHYWNPQKADPSWAYIDKNKTSPRPFIQIGNHRFIELKKWIT